MDCDIWYNKDIITIIIIIINAIQIMSDSEGNLLMLMFAECSAMIATNYLVASVLNLERNCVPPFQRYSNGRVTGLLVADYIDRPFPDLLYQFDNLMMPGGSCGDIAAASRGIAAGQSSGGSASPSNPNPAPRCPREFVFGSPEGFLCLWSKCNSVIEWLEF